MSLARALVLVEPKLGAGGRSPLLGVPFLPCRPAMLLIVGLAWSVLEIANATSNFQGKGGMEHLVKYCYNWYYQLHGSGDGTYKCDKNRMWVSFGTGKEAPVCNPVCGKLKNTLPRQMQHIIRHLQAGKGSFPWQGWLVTCHNLTMGAMLISDQWQVTTGRNMYLNHSENTKLKEITSMLQLFLGGQEQPALVTEHMVLHPGYPKAVGHWDRLPRAVVESLSLLGHNSIFAHNSAHEDPNKDDGVVSILEECAIRLGGIRLPVCVRVCLRWNVVPKRLWRSSNHGSNIPQGTWPVKDRSDFNNDSWVGNRL
uniref:Uncharacterized protein n=1 Tax=Amazona collaria TaxID=241587 RepID=A0A8B9GFF2_9PSIT